MNKTSVLILCTGNSARSQMAEAFLRKYADRFFEVYSAGLRPGEIHPYTFAVMREIGFNLDGHSSKPLNHFVGQMHFGYLITVCDRAEENCPIFPGMGQRLYWPFEDPVAFQGTTDEVLGKFRQIRDQIDVKVKDWLIEKKITPQDDLSFFLV